MSKIILITDWFPTYDKDGIENGKEFVVSHGMDEQGNGVCVTNEHPRVLGAVLDKDLGMWVIED
jgi:hypothetical protein